MKQMIREDISARAELHNSSPGVGKMTEKAWSTNCADVKHDLSI